MVAFALLQIGDSWSINVSMFAMQAAVGCTDVFLLALLLSGSRSVANFGYGLAVLCGGIAAGQFFSLVLGPSSALVGMAGGLVLNMAALSLILRHQRQESFLPVIDAATARSVLPIELVCLLSEREINVLTLVVAGKNYRQVAEELAISESSIKTYMKRICDKTGVPNRLELLRKIGQLQGT